MNRCLNPLRQSINRNYLIRINLRRKFDVITIDFRTIYFRTFDVFEYNHGTIAWYVYSCNIRLASSYFCYSWYSCYSCSNRRALSDYYLTKNLL